MNEKTLIFNSKFVSGIKKTTKKQKQTNKTKQTKQTNVHLILGIQFHGIEDN